MIEHSSIDGETRLTKLGGSSSLGKVSVSGSCFDVICANTLGWSYASKCNGNVYDIYEGVEDGGQQAGNVNDNVSVGIIGCGVAGLSAA